MLLKEEEITHVKLITPKGIELYLEVESTIRTADYVQCAVEKYSGDDPDVTDGMKVYAKAEKIESFLKEEEAEERCFEIKRSYCSCRRRRNRPGHKSRIRAADRLSRDQ